MQMRNRNNQNYFCRNPIDDSVRKAPRLATTCSLRVSVPRLGMFGDPLKSTQYLGKKFITKTKALSIVELDRLVQLRLRRFEQLDLHRPDYLYFCRTSSIFSAFISPRSYASIRCSTSSIHN